MSKRLTTIPEAQKVVIEILETKNIKQWMQLKWKSKDEIDKILESISRRAKYRLLWEVVAVRHMGTFPKEIVWDGAEPSWTSPFQVAETLPSETEVQITEKTKVTCILKDL
jgi:hypothetical protein